MNIEKPTTGKTTKNVFNYIPGDNKSGSKVTATNIIGLLALFYLFYSVAVIFVIGLALIYFALYVILIRVGIGYFFLKPMRSLFLLGRNIIRSLFLSESNPTTYQLSRDDAPELFDLIDGIALKIDVLPPSNIHIVMNMNAFVLLKGYSKGHGDYTLYLGYDLFAILTKPELEWVIAHEIAHSKLVERGLDKFLGRCVNRALKLKYSLDATVANADRSKKKFFIAVLLAKIARQIMTRITRLFGAYSRRDEFAADNLAAKMCSTKSARSVLVKLALSSYLSHNISWRDRIVQIHRKESFSKWLSSSLTPNESEREKLVDDLIKKSRTHSLDTHPSTEDRINAIPEDIIREESDASAFNYLSNPDEIAKCLLTKIENDIAEEERKESQRQIKRAEKRISHVDNDKRAIRAMLLFFACIATACFAILMSNSDYCVLCAFGAAIIVFVIGFICIKRPKKTQSIQVPSFQVWKESFHSEMRRQDVNLWWSSIETELTSSIPAGASSKKEVSDYWVQRSYQALKECDYQRALVSSYNCIKLDKKCTEGILANGIAQAYFYLPDAIKTINKAASNRGSMASISFELGWATSLLEQWEYAEGYFLKAVEKHPEKAKIYAMLAYCQIIRGKQREGIESARMSVLMQPQEISHRVFYMQLLIAAGQTQDAEEEFSILSNTIPTDYDVMIANVRISLMNDNVGEARDRAEEIIQEHASGKTYCSLGDAFLDAGFDNDAAMFFEEAGSYGFYPNSLVGLARTEYNKHNYDRVREFFKSALDVTRELGPDAVSPIELLGTILQGMCSLENQEVNCTAWNAKIDMTRSPANFKYLLLFIFATDVDQAKEIVSWLYSAMHPGQTLADGMIELKQAADNQQPDEPVNQGVYGYKLL